MNWMALQERERANDNDQPGKEAHNDTVGSGNPNSECRCSGSILTPINTYQRRGVPGRIQHLGAPPLSTTSHGVPRGGLIIRTPPRVPMMTRVGCFSVSLQQAPDVSFQQGSSANYPMQRERNICAMVLKVVWREPAELFWTRSNSGQGISTGHPSTG